MSSQAKLNVGFGATVIIGALMLFSSILNVNPFEMVWNTLVYLVLVIGVFIVVPPFLTYAVRFKGIQWVDDQYGGPDDHIPGFFHFLAALILAWAIAKGWSLYVIPLGAQAHALNTWAWEWIRFSGDVNTRIWFWVVYALSLLGYYVASMESTR